MFTTVVNGWIFGAIIKVQQPAKNYSYLLYLCNIVFFNKCNRPKCKLNGRSSKVLGKVVFKLKFGKQQKPKTEESQIFQRSNFNKMIFYHLNNRTSGFIVENRNLLSIEVRWWLSFVIFLCLKIYGAFRGKIMCLFCDCKSGAPQFCNCFICYSVLCKICCGWQEQLIDQVKPYYSSWFYGK